MCRARLPIASPSSIEEAAWTRDSRERKDGPDELRSQGEQLHGGGWASAIDCWPGFVYRRLGIRSLRYPTHLRGAWAGGFHWWVCRPAHGQDWHKTHG